MFKHIIEKIEQFETVIIHRHVRPDPDALGSQIGLKIMIQQTFPEKHVYAVGEEEPSLTFLGEMDSIEDSCYEGALVIVCDTANTARISDDRYDKGEVLIKLDHHPNEEPYGDIVLVDTTVSSTSELIVALQEDTPVLTLNEEAAFLLYAGIVGDTGRFRFRNTTGETLKRTALLLDQGIDTQQLFNQLYRRSLPLVRLEGYILQHFELFDDKVGVMRLPKETLESFHVTANESSLLVNCFSGVEDIQMWVFFVEEEESIRVRLRSKSIVINEIAKQHHGGGHPVAAGATAYSWKEVEDIIGKLRGLAKQNI
ncbi:bifunctional oligoribonuclease/PAP phosphatase NrnA [Shouchella sp. 1P09AA]|uniref:DHH family phosphoesterase n=1 Tax=unclassified Shouchella TaxID=2893065 RepID=UPI0039A16C5F